MATSSESPHALEPTEPPKYLYKLIPSDAAPPDPMPVTLPLSELDAADGFIHVSTANQVPTTARLYFPQETVLYLARIEYPNVRQHVRWEVLGGILCALLYNGPRLGSAEIESVKKLERKGGNGDVEEETWDQVFHKHDGEGWLVW
ncbi:hypothetical protein DL93DRAFT_2091749 [Clavulina sp. PMI_390]|nr:hypothetical protein DL93DRAFT_2091749 [Clavulina sp. PMI_390]